jgi:hypothetical protein
MQRISSTSLAAVGYDTAHAWLDIRFKHGHVYRYLGVPESVYESLMAAQSKGSFFRSEIQDRYLFVSQGKV